MSLHIDITKSFGKGSFTLSVQLDAENSVTALLGASGSGKSMTLKCLAGIEKPDRGQIVLDGEVFFDSEKKVNLSPQQRRIGYLFQNYALFPNMTVEQNIGVSLRHRFGRSEQKERTAGMIRALYLNGLEDRYPPQLSGGQQQRVALARILVSQPRLLMLDEPFSALDSHLRWQLEQELGQVLHEFPGTTLFVSHNRDEVYRLCEKIAVIDAGHVDRVGEKWELFHDPQTYACCVLTGCKNVSAALRTGEDGAIYAKNWGLTLYPSAPIPENLGFVGIRAHQFVPCDTPGPNAFPFEIVRQTEDTFSYILMVRAASAENAELLRWEVNKTTFRQMNLNATPFLRVAPEDFLLLKRAGSA